MHLYEILSQNPEPTIEKSERTFGQDRDILEQIYHVSGVPGLTAALKVLDYGGDPGRVVVTISVWPETHQGKGYAQALYLAALRDGPLNERPQFRSREAARAVERLIQRGLAKRVEEPDGTTLLVAA